MKARLNHQKKFLKRKVELNKRPKQRQAFTIKAKQRLLWKVLRIVGIFFLYETSYWLFCLAKQNRLSKLTPANLSSLRWDDVLTDPRLENDRIEQYKELRRQRYIDAQQETIQKLVEKMKITISDK